MYIYIINSNYGDELVRVSLANLYISILGMQQGEGRGRAR